MISVTFSDTDRLLLIKSSYISFLIGRRDPRNALLSAATLATALLKGSSVGDLPEYDPYSIALAMRTLFLAMERARLRTHDCREWVIEGKIIYYSIDGLHASLDTKEMVLEVS